MAYPTQRVNQQSGLGSTNWDGNTITTNYDPRILGDFYAQIMQRQGQRDVYGIAAENAGVGMETANPFAGLSAVGRQPMQTGYDRSGMAPIPGWDDFSGERQRVEDSLYDRFASRADRRYDLAQTGLENQLRDQGFVPGTEGWDQAMRTFGEGRTDAYQAAVRDAVAGGGAEQTRMLSDALRVRGLQGAEAQQDLQNWNAAQGADFGQQFGLRGQGFGENMAAQQVPMEWLRIAQAGLPTGTMVPSFDLGLNTQDDDAARRNAWIAGLSDLLGPTLNGALGSALGGNSSGSNPLAGLLGPLLGGNGSGSWLDNLMNPPMDPGEAYSDPSWGQDVINGDWGDWVGFDPSWDLGFNFDP